MKSEVILLKKIIVALYLMATIFLFTGCKEQDTTTIVEEPTPNQVEVTATPTPAPTKYPDLTISDYFPFLSNTDFYFVGEGNEYASYHMYYDYINESTGRAQLRINNGGSETVQVLEIKDGKLSIINTQEETYYRDNLLDKTNTDFTETVLLMEPLIAGTSWTLPDGRKSSITGIDVSITTPYGEFAALEVTTENEAGTTKEYYAKDFGLVYKVIDIGDTHITSALSERTTDTPFMQKVQIYQWNFDEDMKSNEVEFELYTNDITRVKFEEFLKLGSDDSQGLISTNTSINSMYLGSDNIAYIDFSRKLVEEMNAGSGFEMQILQCITNTIGNYYGVNDVYLTLDGETYESGHIAMSKGETFKVYVPE